MVPVCYYQKRCLASSTANIDCCPCFTYFNMGPQNGGINFKISETTEAIATKFWWNAGLARTWKKAGNSIKGVTSWEMSGKT